MPKLVWDLLFDKMVGLVSTGMRRHCSAPRCGSTRFANCFFWKHTSSYLLIITAHLTCMLEQSTAIDGPADFRETSTENGQTGNHTFKQSLHEALSLTDCEDFVLIPSIFTASACLYSCRLFASLGEILYFWHNSRTGCAVNVCVQHVCVRKRWEQARSKAVSLGLWEI